MTPKFPGAVLANCVRWAPATTSSESGAVSPVPRANSQITLRSNDPEPQKASCTAPDAPNTLTSAVSPVSGAGQAPSSSSSTASVVVFVSLRTRGTESTISNSHVSRRPRSGSGVSQPVGIMIVLSTVTPSARGLNERRMRWRAGPKGFRISAQRRSRVSKRIS